MRVHCLMVLPADFGDSSAAQWPRRLCQYGCNSFERFIRSCRTTMCQAPIRELMLIFSPGLFNFLPPLSSVQYLSGVKVIGIGLRVTSG